MKTENAALNVLLNIIIYLIYNYQADPTVYVFNRFDEVKIWHGLSPKGYLSDENDILFLRSRRKVNSMTYE